MVNFIVNVITVAFECIPCLRLLLKFGVVRVRLWCIINVLTFIGLFSPRVAIATVLMLRLVKLSGRRLKVRMVLARA